MGIPSLIHVIGACTRTSLSCNWEINGGSPFCSLRCVAVVLTFRNLFNVFGGKPSGCQSATELSKWM